MSLRTARVPSLKIEAKTAAAVSLKTQIIPTPRRRATPADEEYVPNDLAWYNLVTQMPNAMRCYRTILQKSYYFTIILQLAKAAMRRRGGLSPGPYNIADLYTELISI